MAFIRYQLERWIQRGVLRPALLVATVLPGLLAGCTGDVGRAAATSEQDRRFDAVEVVVFRLGESGYPVPPGRKAGALLHGYEAVSRCPLGSVADRQELLADFEEGRARGRADRGIPVDCFRPRHAVRVVEDGVVTDHLLCFECRNLMTWIDGEPAGGDAMSPIFEPVVEQVLDRCAE